VSQDAFAIRLLYRGSTEKEAFMSNSNSPSVDAVIVGGGMAGLAAAAYVARAGRSAVVLERSSHIGGRAITEERSGYYFNLGPHALYKEGSAAAVLRELGVGYSGDEPPQSGYASVGGRLHPLPADPISLLKTSLFGAGAKFETGRFVATINFIKADDFSDTTLTAWLDAKFSRPEVRDLVRALTRLATYANDPDRMSAGIAIRQLQMALKGGVLYLDRGWQSLVDGLRTNATKAGAVIETSAVAIAIEDSGETKTVRLDGGGSYEADSVILATPPKTAAELLGSADTGLRAWVDSAIPVRAATLDIGLSEMPRPDARFVLGVDQPLYLSVHSGVGDLAPDGGTMLHVAKYLGDNQSPPKDVEAELEALLDLAQPGWRDVLVERRFLPNLTVANALATAEAGGLAGRPAVASAMPGVYLAGDWVGADGWLADASLASAKLAANAALDATSAATLAGSVA
jgi:phytoene dehydrogenase-like protein